MALLARASSPKRVDVDVTTDPHHPPKSRRLAICVINDVEPLALILSFVLRVSSKVETNTNVAIGHQPGKAKRAGHRLAAHSPDESATIETKR